MFAEFDGCPTRLKKFPGIWSEVSINQGPGVPAPGGRIVAITLNLADDKVAIAATHSGGLFHTIDAGASWQHLDGLEPNRLWDVQIDPSNPQTVITTVAVDTHKPGMQGVWLSRDGGQTWSMPASLAASRDCKSGTQPAFGRWINFGPGQHVFVGTDCGLAISHDRGNTWSLVAPVSANPGVMGVISRPGPAFTTNPNDVIVDVCGEKGPFRSTDAGSTFNNGATGTAFPIGFCHLARSPDDANVLFAASKSGGTGILWESDDGGITWTQLCSLNNPGRFPWVRATRTSSTAAPNFDLFFHAGADVFRVSCDSSRAGLRCPVPANGPSAFTSPPHDYGGMAFSANGCPRYMGNDHGVVVSADCGQTWNFVHNGLRGLSIYSLSGTVLPDHVDLYFATQDNFIWSSADTGASWQTVPFLPEGLDLQAPHTEAQHGASLVTGTSCAACQRWIWRDHLSAGQGWPASTDQNVPNPNGNPPFIIPGTTGAPSFAQVEGSDLWIRPPNGTWRQVLLGQPLPALASTQLFISGPEADPTIYVVSARADNTHGLVRITGINQANATVTDVSNQLDDVYLWAPDDNPWRLPFVVGVSPQDGRFAMVGDRIRASILTTVDGGNTWFADRNLNSLIVDNGALQFHAPFHGLQAHVIKYNPSNGGHILVGTEASGVIETCDNAFSWHRLSGSRSAKAISDFFFDELNRRVYVATYGRGLWRIDYPRPRVGVDPCWEGIGPITLPSGRLSFSVATNPVGDPAQVQIRLNGSVWAGPVGGGFTSAPRPLSPGVYHLQVSLLPQFSPLTYDISTGGSCQPTGAVNVVQSATANCTILIRHR